MTTLLSNYIIIFLIMIFILFLLYFMETLCQYVTFICLLLYSIVQCLWSFIAFLKIQNIRPCILNRSCCILSYIYQIRSRDIIWRHYSVTDTKFIRHWSLLKILDPSPQQRVLKIFTIGYQSHSNFPQIHVLLYELVICIDLRRKLKSKLKQLLNKLIGSYLVKGQKQSLRFCKCG